MAWLSPPFRNASDYHQRLQTWKHWHAEGAIIFILEIGLQDVVFKGDSEVIIKHLKAYQPCLTAFGHIIEEARALSAKLRKASFSHTRHKGNNVVDKLTKLAKNLYEP